MTRRPCALAALALAAAFGLPPSLPHPAAAQEATGGAVAGTWTGPFGGADWTFAFIRADGTWSGRSMTSRAPRWADLRALAVSDRAVTFEIESTPVVRFDLALDASGEQLEGVIKAGDRTIAPFSAGRQR